MHTDRTPVVLALLADALQTRAAEHPDDHDLHALADGVALAVDHGAVATLWPPTTDDAETAEWVDNRLDDGEVGDCEPYRFNVARRLADVAASLRVRGEGLRLEAEALWGAASRLLGFEAEPTAVAADRYLDNERRKLLAGNERMRHEALDRRIALRRALVLPASCGDDHATLCERVAMVVKWRDEVGHPAVAEVGRLRLGLASMQEQRDAAEARQANIVRETMEIADELKANRLDLASMTEQRDEALRQLADLRRELQDAHAGRRWDLAP